MLFNYFLSVSPPEERKTIHDKWLKMSQEKDLSKAILLRTHRFKLLLPELIDPQAVSAALKSNISEERKGALLLVNSLVHSDCRVQTAQDLALCALAFSKNDLSEATPLFEICKGYCALCGDGMWPSLLKRLLSMNNSLSLTLARALCLHVPATNCDLTKEYDSVGQTISVDLIPKYLQHCKAVLSKDFIVSTLVHYFTEQEPKRLELSWADPFFLEISDDVKQYCTNTFHARRRLLPEEELRGRYRLDPEPMSVHQKGHTCKLYALSSVMSWLFEKTKDLKRKTPPPACKSDCAGAGVSVRQIAKRLGHTKIGEIYDPQHLLDIAQACGFTSTKVLDCPHEEYSQTLISLLHQDLAPIVFFDVDIETGQPTLRNGESEHAAVAVGYFYTDDNELYIMLKHWGGYWEVKARDLADSANNLSQRLSPEWYYRIEGLWRTEGDRRDHALHDFQDSIDTAVAKVEGVGPCKTFANKIVLLS